MTLPSSTTISVDQIRSEVTVESGDLGFLNGYIKPDIRPASPNMASFWGLKYYLQNTAGNCNDGGASNCNCNNCSSPIGNCSATNNCTNINCINCDTQNG
jgi:hypothetical protein